MRKVNKKNIPTVRFPEFIEAWTIRSGSELFVNSRSKGNEELPIFSVTLNDGLVPRDSLERRMENDAAATDNLQVESGNLVYNMMRMWQGAVGLANCKCMVSPAYVVLAGLSNVDTVFFYFNLKRAETLYQLWSYSYGLTNDRLRLYFKDFGKIKFSIPSDKQEQEKIAAFLTRIDEKITILRRKRELLETYKRGLMQKLFSQEVRFRQDNGSYFPDWLEMKFGNSFLERSEKGFSDAELLSVKMIGGVVKRSDIEGKVSASNDRSNYKRVKVNDIAYNSMRMWQGASGQSQYEGIVSPAYTVVTPKEHADSLFFSYLFKYPPVINLFRRYSQGLTSDTWNLKYPAFSNIKYIVPSCIEEQRKIAMILSLFDQKLTAIDQKITQLETFKKGLLQQMFV